MNGVRPWGVTLIMVGAVLSVLTLGHALAVGWGAVGGVMLVYGLYVTTADPR